MQKASSENWGLFRKMMFEQLDMEDLGEFIYNMDVLDQMVDKNVYSLQEVRGLYTHRANNGEGFCIGHKICRRRLGLLAARFKT